MKNPNKPLIKKATGIKKAIAPKKLVFRQTFSSKTK